MISGACRFMGTEPLPAVNWDGQELIRPRTIPCAHLRKSGMAQSENWLLEVPSRSVPQYEAASRVSWHCSGMVRAALLRLEVRLLSLTPLSTL